MKKILKYYLPISITFFALFILTVGYFLRYHPVLLQYLIGYAKVYSPPIDAVVKINGIEESDAKVFLINEISKDKKLLVYCPDCKQTYSVIIINKTKKDIGSTNSGEGRYDLLFNRYLFQSDGAYDVVYASSEKWGYNPNLEITNSQISYTMPKLENANNVDVKVEIIFKGE